MSSILKIVTFKIHKVPKFLKIPKIFLNKGTKHKKNYMKSLN